MVVQGSNPQGRCVGPRETEMDANWAELAAGTRVEVRNSFSASWSRGFEVAEATHAGYRLRRVADRYVLPVEFVAHEVRRAS